MSSERALVTNSLSTDGMSVMLLQAAGDLGSRRVKRLLLQCNGRPEKVWNDKLWRGRWRHDSENSKCIGQKKGTMAVNILVRDYGVAITGTKEDIDASNDTHVRRVFVRSGLAVQSTS